MMAALGEKTSRGSDQVSVLFVFGLAKGTIIRAAEQTEPTSNNFLAKERMDAGLFLLRNLFMSNMLLVSRASAFNNKR